MGKAIPAWRAVEVVKAGRAFKTLNSRLLNDLAAGKGKGRINVSTVNTAAFELWHAARKAWSAALDVNGWRE